MSFRGPSRLHMRLLSARPRAETSGWGRLISDAIGVLVAAAMLIFSCSARAESITIGLVGTASATHWPIYSGLKQGYYDAANIKHLSDIERGA